MNLMQKLVSLRKEHKFSQEELAERLGVSRQTISKWERGEASPDMNNAILLCKIYGISLDEIARCITGEEEPAKKSRGISLKKESYRNVAESAAVKEDCMRMVLPERETEEIYPQLNAYRSTEKADIKPENMADRKPNISVKIPENRSVSVRMGNSAEKSASAYKREKIGRKLMKFPFWALAALMFLFFGGVFDGWEYSWLVFLTVPVYYMTIAAYIKNNMMYFPYPILVTIFFIYIMMIDPYNGDVAEFTAVWTFGSIPLFYTGIAALRKKKCKFFCFPMLMTMIFLSGAIMFNGELFLWVFALIPFYYIYSSNIDRIIFGRKNK